MKMTKTVAVVSTLCFAITAGCITFNAYDSRRIDLEKHFAEQQYSTLYSEALNKTLANNKYLVERE